MQNTVTWNIVVKQETLSSCSAIIVSIVAEIHTKDYSLNYHYFLFTKLLLVI